ncbi:MAG: hypothetical protein ABR526_08195 [Chthoniobacterales bacterium]
MNDVFEGAAELQAFLLEKDWRFCFIGGIAVQRWSNPRQTEDADLTLLTGFGAEQPFIDSLLASFRSRSTDEREAALLRRVLFLESSSGVGLDIALGGLPFEERSVTRATRWNLESGMSLITCSAEDLIVHKAFAARDQDWADVTNIVIRHGRKLNTAQILEELRPLVDLKDEPEILVKLQTIFNRYPD